ncbi:MAG: DNA polymerase I [Coriobacteriia bacterium]|nr:DNA polymerase I [Coriobacteriia bacterium]
MPERTIAVVDGNSLLHRAFHGLPPSMTAPDGRPTNAVFGFMSMLFKMVTDLGPDGVVVAFDRGKPAFRTEALAQYKIQRPPTDPDLKSQFPMIKELLGALSIPIVEVDGWEGDDILGTLAARGSAEGVRVLLITGDKDALQLVDENVRVVSTKKGITDIFVYDHDAVVDRYGVTPGQVADFLGLKGDPSDNIPGIPGVGEKTAAKLLQQYGTLDAVLEHADELKGKLGENVRGNVDSALASRVVATIRRDVPIELDLGAVTWGVWDESTALGALTGLAFTSLIPRFRSMCDVEMGAAGHVPEEGAAEWHVLTGDAAAGWVAACAADAPVGPIGIAAGVAGGECLFEDERMIAFAYKDTVATLSGGDATSALAAVLTACRVSAGDIKELIEGSCPPGSSAAVVPSVTDGLDSARLFDSGIAGYLLASNRSKYDVASLAAEYLGRTVEPGDVAAEARAVAELAPVLADKLEEWGATQCFREIEMPLVPVLVRMEEAGVGLDRRVLDALSSETHAQIEAIAGEIYELAGTEFTIDSPKQLGEILFDKLQLPTQKKTKTGYSTDAGVLAALSPLHPIADKVVAYRELTKLTSTYIDVLPRLVGEDGRLHTTFNQTVAATGRLSSSSPNLQNIPVRTELGRRIRAAFVPAREGDLMVSADYSQIELRILAHLSGDPGLIEAFTSGADFHAATAARVFDVEPEDVDPEMRRKAKAVNFGIVYGISAHGLGDSLGIGYAEAQATIDRYFAAYPRVREYLDEAIVEAHKMGYAETMFGRRRPIPELRNSNFNLRSFGERTAMNHPMQGTAADLMKLAMIEVDRRLRSEGFEARMVLQVHDELIFEAPVAEMERLTTMVREAMAGVADLSVSLEVGIGAGVNWAEAK